MTEAPFSPDRPASAVGGELRLPKPPGVIRQFWARHPRLTDVLIAAIYLLPALLGFVLLANDALQPSIWETVRQLVAVALGTGVLVVFRRSRPWLVMVVAWVLGLTVYPYGTNDVYLMLFALYGLGVYRSTKSAWIGFAGSVAVSTAASYLAPWVAKLSAIPSADTGFSSTAAASQYAVLLLVATLIGVTVGNRRRYLVALIARAHDLARERDQQAQLAAVAERARIARELHDIVSHGLTVMVTLAEGSAATVARDPDRAAEVMRSVAETGRDALGEMRRMLGVLAGPDAEPAELAPQPGLDALPELVEGFRETGLPVTLTTVGAPVDDAASGLAVYRIVQEGLTNALRHGERAHRVEVRVEHQGDRVEITIDDDAPHAGAGDVPRSSTRGAGRGLAGLRERAALYGGTLEAGPRAGRGWRLHAVLRHPARAPHETTEDTE